MKTQDIIKVIHETFTHKSQTLALPLEQSQELWEYNIKAINHFNRGQDIHHFILTHGLENGKITLPYLCRNLQDMSNHQLDYIIDFINTCYHANRVTKQIINKLTIYFFKQCHRNSRDLECLYNHEQSYLTSCNLKKYEYSQFKILNSKEEIQDYLWLFFIEKASQILKFPRIWFLNDNLNDSELWFLLTILKSNNKQLRLSYPRHKKYFKEIEREFKLLLIQEVIRQTTPIL